MMADVVVSRILQIGSLHPCMRHVLELLPSLSWSRLVCSGKKPIQAVWHNIESLVMPVLILLLQLFPLLLLLVGTAIELDKVGITVGVILTLLQLEAGLTLLFTLLLFDGVMGLYTLNIRAVNTDFV